MQRRDMLIKSSALLAASALGGLSACATTPFQGPASDHFDGERFFNPWGRSTNSFGRFLSWQFNREKAVWPEWVDNPPAEPTADRIGGSALRASFVNHATVLLQTRDLNILTDPVWSKRVSPLSFIGPSRVRDPGIAFADLPKIDVVTVSHNHYDHMDLPTLAKLMARDDPLIIVPLNNAHLIKSAAPDARIAEVDWYDKVAIQPGIELRSVPAQHWSSRRGFDRNQSLWSAFVLETKDGPIYIAGDTGLGPHFEPEQQRYGGFRLALLPIGAYEPRWFMQYQHMNPDDAVQAHALLKTDASLAVHFGTFQLTDEGIDAPVQDLTTALQAHGTATERFRALTPGQGWDVT